ncbi:MAG TPA: nuclear transport factor 2 family protein [Minicystis sp.]|nr:nuclear transport factor 2 family protein [Minicystis sp.]
MSDAREILQSFLDRAWTKRDASAIDELREPDAGSEGLADGPLDAEAFKAFHARMLATFSEVRVEIVDAVEQGDHVAARVELEARRGDRLYRLPGALFARVTGGRIVRSWNLFDVAALLHHAGAVPAPDLASAVASLR